MGGQKGPQCGKEEEGRGLALCIHRAPMPKTLLLTSIQCSTQAHGARGRWGGTRPDRKHRHSSAQELHQQELLTAIAGMKYQPEDRWEGVVTTLLHQLDTLSQEEEEGL